MFLYDQIIALNLGVAVVMIAKVRNVFSFTSLLLVAISNISNLEVFSGFDLTLCQFTLST